MTFTDGEIEVLKECLRMLSRRLGDGVEIEPAKDILKKLEFSDDEINKISTALIVANGLRNSGVIW